MVRSLTSADDPVPDMSGEGRAEGPNVLEIDRFVEPVEQPLARTEYDRRDRHRELVEVTRAERLADDVGAAHDVDVLVSGDGTCPGDGRLESVDEREPRVRRLILG